MEDLRAVCEEIIEDHVKEQGVSSGREDFVVFVFLLEFGFVFGPQERSVAGLCVFLCLVDNRGQENARKFGSVFIFKYEFVFIVFLLKMNSDLNLYIF